MYVHRYRALQARPRPNQRRPAPCWTCWAMLGLAGPVLGAADRFLFASDPLTESHSPAPLFLPKLPFSCCPLPHLDRRAARITFAAH